MLDFIRNKAKSTVIQLVILAIVLVFIFWGVGSNQETGPNAIATVNGQDISLAKYEQAYQQTIDRYQQQFGGTLPPELLKATNIRQQVLDQVIRQRLMEQAAIESGLTVGSEEIQKEIEKMGAFQENGRFSIKRYKEVLAASRLNPLGFEEGIRTDLLQERILRSLDRLVRVADRELTDRYAYDNDRIRLEYAVFAADEFRSKVAPSDDKLAAFMKQHQGAYQTEPEIRLRFLSFPRTNPAAGSADPDLPFRLASKAYEEIIQAGSLEKYAAASGAALAETGFFKRSAPPSGLAGQEALLASLFVLKKGELSSLLETGDGYAIFFLEELKGPQIPPLAQVRARVEADFIAFEARQLAKQAATALLAKAKKEGGLGAESGRVQMSGLYSRADRGQSGLPAPVADQGLRLGTVSRFPAEVLANEDRFYVLRFKEMEKAGEEGFAAAKEAIRKELIQGKREELLNAWIKQLESEAKIRKQTV